MNFTDRGGPGERRPEPARAAGFAQQLSGVTELPIVLVACVVVGGIMGVGIDRLLNSKPIGMLLLGALGFAAGVREILRKLSKPAGGKGGGSAGPTQKVA